jgi:histidinol dehydrogenase
MSKNTYLKTYKTADLAKKNLLCRKRISLVDYKLPKEQQAKNKELFKKNLSPYQLVSKIISDVIKNGDLSVKEYCNILDGSTLDSLIVSENEFEEAFTKVNQTDVDAIKFMATRIRNYHEIQLQHAEREFFQNGFGIKVVAINTVGIYMTGSLTSLPSSIIHTAMPASVAGVNNIYGITPTDKAGKVNPYKLIAARFAGIEKVYKASGAQAIASFAFGTESIPQVDKIAGPGNIFVAMAKQQVNGAVGVDGLYGPTETLIIADEHADPEICTADILHAAEHDALAIPILITDSKDLASSVSKLIQEKLETFDRSDVIESSLKNGGIVITEDIDEAIILSNMFGPEHLCISTKNAESLIPKIQNAGGIFVGEGTPEVIGDYTGGISHVMPTGGAAKFSSPLSIYDFQKIISIANIQELDLAKLGPYASQIAKIEGLDAHANSIDVRLEKLK